jgi:hypothetical protein
MLHTAASPRASSLGWTFAGLAVGAALLAIGALIVWAAIVLTLEAKRQALDARDIGTQETIPTRIYNGYGEYVAAMCAGMTNEPLFM